MSRCFPVVRALCPMAYDILSCATPFKEFSMRRFIVPSIFFTLAAAVAVTAPPSFAQTGAKNGEWNTYGGDLGNTRYAPLNQISADNFNKLQVAWRFHTDNLGARPEYNLEATPLVVKGVMYSLSL